MNIRVCRRKQPHRLAFAARVGPVGYVASGMGWPHRLAFAARVRPVVGYVVSGLAPPTRVCSEGGACGMWDEWDSLIT